jgi:peptidyl-prolyl cis-trans isomerase A (cyclophilin A)
MVRRSVLTLLSALVAGSALAQTPAQPLPQTTPLPFATSTPVEGQTPDPSLPRVAIDTSEGRFVLAIETRRAPVTAANFLRYVDQKRLDGRRVYRVSHVGNRFGFIQLGMNGDPKLSLPPIKHEPTTLTGVKHLEGTISTARLAPGTARGEFTLMVGDQPGLDADPTKPGDNLGYAAFGRVVEGFDVVLRIFDKPIDPVATVRGSFKGEVPAAPVRILTARRIRAAP